MGTQQQAFLHGYRAICRELYSKTGALRAIPVQRARLDQGTPEPLQREIQEGIDWHEQGLQLGLADLQSAKATYDRALLSGDYSPIATAVM
jgi:hypothetical protein